jgi:DNA repair and recombination protein RAD52
MTPEIKEKLSAPLDAKNVASRTQSGRTLSYVEGWHVIAEANRIFGFDGWHRETVEMREVRPPELVKGGNGKETWRVGFVAKVRVTVGSVVREGTGFGAGALPDLGEAYESAIKEAETDAMKRAFMTFGNPFGLALYDKSQANVSSGPSNELEALRRNMRQPKTQVAAREWYEKQKAAIDDLSNAEFAIFKAEFVQHLKSLPVSTLEAA